MPSNVLVVDDEAAVRDLFSDLLKRENCTVKSAATGEEALDMINQEDFDIAFLDIKLPGINGLEALKRIKSIKPDIIAVMITGFGYDEGLIAEAKKNGSSGYIGKNMPTSEIRGIFKFYIEMAQEKG